MLILIQQHGTDSALGARDAFDHGQHHPSHGRVLTQDFERFVGLADDHHFVDHAPLAHAQRARQVVFFFRNAGDDLGHAGDEKYRYRKDQQIQFEYVSGAGHQGKEKREAYHGEKTQLAEQGDDRSKERDDREIGHAEREQRGERESFQIQNEAGDEFGAETRLPHFAERLENFFRLGQEDRRRKNPDEKQQRQLECDHPAHGLFGDHLVG